VAFPGGRAEAIDKYAHDVAERETWEEIGLKLEAHHRVGPLPTRAIDRGDLPTRMTLSPFVYYVGGKRPAAHELNLNYEVADVFWVPLRHLFDDAAATELEYPMGGTAATFPGIQFEDHVIWGLTLRVLQSFADIMQRSLAVAR
jgi:8-oxo-dGTP pyrophosphatase MutT (NUDIX family)